MAAGVLRRLRPPLVEREPGISGASRQGRAGQIGPLLAELEAERTSLAAPASVAIGAGVDVEALRPAIEVRLREIGAAFAGAAVERRAAFRALLGDRRMRVLPDAEREIQGRGAVRAGARNGRRPGL